MSRYDFPDSIIAKIKASAATYAQASARNSHSSICTSKRVKLLTGYILSQPGNRQEEELNKSIKIVASKITSEQIKAKCKSNLYNPYHQIELHKLHNDLIKKRNEL